MAQYAIHWTADGEEDVTVVTGCDLSEDAKLTFKEKYPNREIQHINMVSETIESQYHSWQESPKICEECGEEMKYFMISPEGDDTTYMEAYGCPECFITYV